MQNVYALKPDAVNVDTNSLYISYISAPAMNSIHYLLTKTTDDVRGGGVTCLAV